MRIWIVLVLMLCVSVYAGTLDDIRLNSGWQSRNHSERNSIYIPHVTPAILIANLDKYNRDTIKMQVLFHGITTDTLNTWIGPKNNRYRWSSTKYVSFKIKDPQEQVSPRDIHLFISKDNPDSDKLFDLTQNTPILLVGTVRDITKGKAWVEVEKIELL